MIEGYVELVYQPPKRVRYTPRYPWKKRTYLRHIAYTNKSFYTAPTQCYSMCWRKVK